MIDPKPPELPKRVDAGTLAPDLFHSDEEYSGWAFDGGLVEIGSCGALEHVGFQTVQFRNVVFDTSVFYAPKLTDVSLDGCSLVNTNFERLIARRVEFVGCRLLGLNVTDGHFQDVIFRDCDLQLARFRFSTFTSALFEECNLKDANFQGADLTGISFHKCNLTNVEMSQAKLGGTDFRTSAIEGLRVGPEEVVGAVVDHFQAAYMASLLGLVIKSDDEG